MGILDKVKYDIDTPLWRQMKPFEVAHSAGSLLCCDKRNDIQADHSMYYVASATALYRQSGRYNGPILVGSPALAAFAVGGASAYLPSFGITGTIGAGSSTTKIVTSAASSVGSAIGALGLNQLVTTDTDYGYRIRIIGKASGKTEERYIFGNTASATPVIYLDEALSFTPANGDLFEIQSGQVLMVAATTTAAGQSRLYNVANNAFANAGALGITTATAATMVALDELYVPYDRVAGEGFLGDTATYDTAGTATVTTKHCIQASAVGASTISGQVTGGDVRVLANEYRNFQIRIVEDTVNVTAVGQRRMIASHTAGTSGATAPVYTLGAAWSVTPSTSAKFVIENPNLVILQSAASNTNLTYNYSNATINNATASITAFTWSNTYFNGAKASPVAAGCMMFPAYGHEPVTQSDGARLSRHGDIYCFRGNGTALDKFDIAGGVAGLWTLALVYTGNTVTWGAASSGDYDPVTFLGEYAYMVEAASNRVYQFNIAAPSVAPYVKLPLQSGTAAGGQRVCVLPAMQSKEVNIETGQTDVDEDSKLAMVFVQSHLSTNVYRSDIIG